MPISDTQMSNCGELTIDTTNEDSGTPPDYSKYLDFPFDDDGCLDEFVFGPTTPPETEVYQPTFSFGVSEHDHAKRSGNVDRTTEWDGQQSPKFGARGISPCQSQSANQPYMSEESPSAFEGYGQGLDPSNRSAYPPAYPPTPPNPNRPSFRPQSRATGGTASSANEKSLVLYTGPRGGSIGRAESSEKRPSQSGAGKRGRGEEPDEDNDELYSKFRKMSLKGVSRYSRKRG